MSTTNPRRTHRKRISALRLSSDTTATLPEYVTVGWHRPEDLPSDKPPDYPDSAEEADEDTDSGNDITLSPCVTPAVLTGPLSPRRHRRFLSHRRKQSTSSNDPYLDSLLARSVHALEMSNVLLQTSISTQSSLSTVLASDSRADATLEISARELSSRIRGTGRVHDTWVDNLEEIRIGVEGLFGGEENRRSSSHSAHSTDNNISCSLPTSSLPSRLDQHRRRTSLSDLRKANSEYQAPQLHLSLQNRSDLISPPPRALTQYSLSTDPGVLTLPSTLGLRASPSSHTSLDWKPLADALSPHLHATISSPKLTNRTLEPSTPAYNMLASFVTRTSSGSSTPSTLTLSHPSYMSTSRRDSRNASTSSERNRYHSPRSSPSRVARKSPENTNLNNSPSTSRCSRSQALKQPIPSLSHRPMTPPLEESSSSSDGCPAKLTILTLRKILDEQPVPQSNGDSAEPHLPPPRTRHLRPPAFLPRTPAPAAEAGTSTATASVSRLFTKAKHSSSTRPPSPPRQSAMKHSSSSTPSPSPTTVSIPDMLEAGVAKMVGTPTSSGWSTPKRISFAELPESYASTRPAGSSSKFKKKNHRGKPRVNGADLSEKAQGKDSSKAGGWWTSWLVGAHGSPGVGLGSSRHEERMEDRMARNWAGRVGPGFGAGLEEWTV